MANHDFLFKLLHAASPTGFETEGQLAWLESVRESADIIGNDAYGTAWGTLIGTQGKDTTVKLMLEAHVDEVGYMVSHVMPDGFLRLRRLGYPDIALARSRKISIMGDKGRVTGVIGQTAIHLREDFDNEKAPKIHELFVDVGATTAKEVEALGIRVGHPAVYMESVLPIGKNRIAGRGLDNGLGSYVIAEVMQRLSEKKKRQPGTVHIVNAVQEEIGGYGATMATERLRPTIAIAIDVTHATDTPGLDHARTGDLKLGGGPSITHGRANHPQIVKMLMKIAEKKKIPIQHQAPSVGTRTDTDAIYHMHGGIPSALLSIPLRYMHTTVETADVRDVDHCIELLVDFAMELDSMDDMVPKL